jgi:hypothetical protein
LRRHRRAWGFFLSGVPTFNVDQEIVKLLALYRRRKKSAPSGAAQDFHRLERQKFTKGQRTKYPFLKNFLALPQVRGKFHGQYDSGFRQGRRLSSFA